ncbi:MAG TPA: YggS family pyridoxal phosphate-dependent enzyme [Acidimicrobiales bacterium]|nr:YggS family pyridoxal phosphate-dependent enzyme [Acidimicrobiales bacterium]
MAAVTAGPAAPAVLADDVRRRLADVRRRVEASGGDPGRVRIVAVTKGFGPDAVEAAHEAGLDDVGENYAQELMAKAPGAPAGTRWHFLGPVQRNKVRHLAPVVTTWHGIDRRAAADAVAAAAPGAEVMVQVNVVGSPDRPGCPATDVADLVEHVRGLPLDLSGLMAVGPAEVGPQSRASFRWLAGRAAELGLRELSMGMSEDFEMAVAEGATTLRLGRVLFGARPEPAVDRR